MREAVLHKVFQMRQLQLGELFGGKLFRLGKLKQHGLGELAPLVRYAQPVELKIVLRHVGSLTPASTCREQGETGKLSVDAVFFSGLLAPAVDDPRA